MRYILGLILILLLISGCTPATPVTPTPTLAPTLTPTATLTPSPTPTATPIPPLTLAIEWPERVSAVEPAVVIAALIPPPGITTNALLDAAVFDPTGEVFAAFDLLPRPDHRYSASAPLQLPLDPLTGTWRIEINVTSTQEISGAHTLAFEPAPIAFYDLEMALPPGASIRVPEAFYESIVQGTPYAGGRVWHYEGGELSLWWAPGPAEPFQYQSAIVLLEATHPPGEPPTIRDFQETQWGERPALYFEENWPSFTGGPAEAWVIQGRDYWLYVLRIRSTEGDAIPTLLREVGATFTVD